MNKNERIRKLEDIVLGYNIDFAHKEGVESKLKKINNRLDNLERNQELILKEMKLAVKHNVVDEYILVERDNMLSGLYENMYKGIYEDAFGYVPITVKPKKKKKKVVKKKK